MAQINYQGIIMDSLIKNSATRFLFVYHQNQIIMFLEDTASIGIIDVIK